MHTPTGLHNTPTKGKTKTEDRPSQFRYYSYAVSNSILKENILLHTNITEEWKKTSTLMNILLTTQNKG